MKRDPLNIIKEALATYDPVAVYVLFSGGNDSTTLLDYVRHAWHLVDPAPPLQAAHINTGIGIEQTRVFVRKFCADINVPLREMHAKPGEYEWMVKRWGFPGPSMHNIMYTRLKERGLDKLVSTSRRPRSGEKVMLITGVRSSESARRLKTNYQPIEIMPRQKHAVWVAPMIDYTKDDLAEVRANLGTPENEVAALLHMSGECLCGAFARPDEIKEIEAFFPETAREIHRLEAEVKALGHKRCVWGKKIAGEKRAKVGPLCSGCEQMAMALETR